MMTISDTELHRWLAEDVPYGDLTTRTLGIDNQKGLITLAARQPMVAACSEEAARLLQLAGAHPTDVAASGIYIPTGGLLLAATGSAAALHAGWKVAQVLLETAGGIATAARAIVEAVRATGSQAAVACTRKCLPGTRSMAIKAILCGGAVPHRLGLSESVLLFAQHRAFCGETPLSALVDRLRRHSPEKKIVVEASTLDDAQVAVDAGADVVQLDKVAPDAIAQLRKYCEGCLPRPVIAAAGGINAANAADFARAGADVIVTSAPYTAHPLDVKVTLHPELTR